ncbi:MAG: hypothetical protein IPP15_23360 [Saprospiraceae bacterium]|uniref:Uncharacterized protein n=1 Tax=Candidatus Opimibacter skivensis TaxID=2982028 RepID=A0A9D7SXU9_9BACT|nr:hypothetical protein [Candidatus Opimibacter skivensis]
MAGACGDFKNEYYQLDYYVNGDAQADDAYAGGDNPDNFQIDDYQLDAVNRNVSRDWAYLYSTIGKVNNIINNAEEVTDPDLTPSRKMKLSVRLLSFAPSCISSWFSYGVMCHCNCRR